MDNDDNKNWTEIHIKVSERNKQRYESYKDQNKMTGNEVIDKLLTDSDRIDMMNKDRRTRFIVLNQDLTERCNEFDSITSSLIKNNKNTTRLNELNREITDILNQMDVLVFGLKRIHFMGMKTKLIKQLNESLAEYIKEPVKSLSSTVNAHEQTKV